MRLKYAFTALVLLLMMLHSFLLSAQAPELPQALAKARYPLQLTEHGFSGPGAPILTAALDGAKYVAIGEDHFTREIPQFAAAVCDEMAPHGLTALAMEASPGAAEFVTGTLGQPDRLARIAELQRRFPDSVAFLNSRQENDLADHCAAVAKANHFELWGLDQEYMGSAGWLLSRMAYTNPGPKARTAIAVMQHDEQAAAAEAAQTGDALKLYLLTATDAQVAAAQSSIDQDGTPATRALFHELTESRTIYREHLVDNPTSNAYRAHLLKHNFLAAYQAAGGDARPQRVLVKLGDWHIYRGYNPIPQRDFGNFLAEHADISGAPSLHIMVMGLEGEHVVYGGYGRPLKHISGATVSFEGYRWLKPAADLADNQSLTLYDIRKLRFGHAANLSPEWEKVIYGYDLLVLIPQVTPADLVH